MAVIANQAISLTVSLRGELVELADEAISLKGLLRLSGLRAYLAMTCNLDSNNIK